MYSYCGFGQGIGLRGYFFVLCLMDIPMKLASGFPGSCLPVTAKVARNLKTYLVKHDKYSEDL
jgi:hypothetical protein